MSQDNYDGMTELNHIQELQGKQLKKLGNMVDDMKAEVQELQKRAAAATAINEPKKVVETVSVNADSITLGAPTNGQIKVYGDFEKTKEFAQKLRNAVELLKATKAESVEGKN